MIIHNGSSVAARVLQVGASTNFPPPSSILVLFSDGLLAWMSGPDGKFVTSSGTVNFTGANCTGTAYWTPIYDSGTVLNRLYVFRTDSGAYHSFYQVTGFATSTVATVSQLNFGSIPGMGTCSTAGYTIPAGRAILTQVSTRTDLTALAPLKIEFE
jgi:hypothetical protein